MKSLTIILSVLVLCVITAGADTVSVLVPSDSIVVTTPVPVISTIDLDEVVVTAPVKEIEFRGDTTIINADAYRVPDGAYLQELVRLVPGLEYDSSTGILSYCGRSLNEIVVNGEKFFGSDVVAALENMPVELISRLKVYDKATDVEAFTGVRDGRKNYVLDIQTKQKLDGMLRAGAEIGIGTKDRRHGRLSASSFRSGGTNYSVSADTGNKNITSGFKGNRDDTMRGNFSKYFNKIYVTAGGSYFGRVDGDERSSFNESYLLTGNKFTYSTGDNNSKSRSIRLNGAVRGSLGSKTFLTSNLAFGDRHRKSDARNRSAIFSSDPGLGTGDPLEGSAFDGIPRESRINTDRSYSSSASKSRDYDGRLELIRNLNQSGTSIQLQADFRRNTNVGDGYNISEITYYQMLSATGSDSVLYRNQYNLTPSRSHVFGLGLYFSHKLNKKLFMKVGYKFERGRERNLRSVYDLSPWADDLSTVGAPYLPQDYLQSNVDSLSNHSFSRTTGHELSFSLLYFSGAFKANAMLQIKPERQSLDQKIGLISGDTVRRSLNVVPNLSVGMNCEKYDFDLSYTGHTQQPSLSQLMLMTDNSNPLYITHGNPALKASYRQEFSASGAWHKPNIRANLSYANVYNKQTEAVFYDVQTGVSEVYPVNISGEWSMRSDLWFMHRVRKVDLMARLGANYDHQLSLLQEGDSPKPVRSVTLGRVCNSALTVRYMSTWGTMEVGGEWRFNNIRNQLRDTRNSIRDYSVNSRSDFNFLKRFTVGYGAKYTLRSSSIAGGHGDHEFLLGFNCSWSFLRKKAMRLSATWVDVLNKKYKSRSVGYQCL